MNYSLKTHEEKNEFDCGVDNCLVAIFKKKVAKREAKTIGTFEKKINSLVLEDRLLFLLRLLRSLFLNLHD